ncbi:MAG: hypothetical protein JNM18_21515 [Planctomycetaceae bacterium]|nr:hypothetical protein [Planctomycetaceae bacterium]
MSDISTKMAALSAALGSRLHVKCISEKDGLFSAYDPNYVGAHHPPVFVVLTDHEHSMESPDSLNRLQEAYGGYLLFVYEQEKFHFYSGHFQK